MPLISKRAAFLVALVLAAAATTLGWELLPRGRSHEAARSTSGSTRRTGTNRAPERRPRHVAPKARNVYAADGAGMLKGASHARPLVYVPNSDSATVDMIDPRTYAVVSHFAVGALPQHVVPAYDLKTLYVTNDLGNSLTPIDPRTGKPRRPIAVDDPYNLYFTPDGRSAIVVAERLRRLDFRNPHSFRLQRSLAVPCGGINHLDFSWSGSYAIASCEFSGEMLKLDIRRRRVAAVMRLPRSSAIPQDVRAAPDGRLFYVADLAADGVWRINGDRFRIVGFTRTGAGAHGLVVSRDARFLYVANRNAGSVSVIAFRSGKVIATWRLPGGGSPDMGGVSASGKVLWLSGRYNAEVYAIATRTGKLLARIDVGASPHGVCVWPQPGRHSLGHVGTLR